MKTTLLLLSLLVYSGFSHAQNASWDSLRVPDVYPSRVELFRATPTTKKDIVLLGNSITFWGEWNLLLKSKRVRNQGIPGDTSFGLLRRLDEATRGKPAGIFILIGINDLGRNIPDTIILRNYKRMVHRIKEESPRTKIYLQTLLPTNETFEKLKNLYGKETNIAFINSQLKELAQLEGVIWVDLHSHFTDQEGRLKKEYTWDGVHLSLAGYQKWAEILDSNGYLKAKRLR